jgi:hypothetical protein
MGLNNPPYQLGGPGSHVALTVNGLGGGDAFGSPSMSHFVPDNGSPWLSYFGNLTAGPNYGLAYYQDEADFGFYLAVGDGAGDTWYPFIFYPDGTMYLQLPTVKPAIGALWNDGGIVKVST